MAKQKGVENIRDQIDHFCVWVRADSENITSFFGTLKNAIKEDKTIEDEVKNTEKYKNFVQSLEVLSEMIKRILEVIEVLKGMSHIYVFDFDSFYEQLNEYLGVINSNMPEQKENIEIEPQDSVCNECFHWVEEPVEYEKAKYHASCINYRISRNNNQ